MNSDKVSTPTTKQKGGSATLRTTAEVQDPGIVNSE